MDVPLGTTAVELDSRNATVRTREAAIGNLIADAMRASTSADVAIMNGGGIRGGKVYPPGTAITRRDVLAELPFGNRVVTIEISGADAQGGDRERPVATAQCRPGGFPQVSGMTVEADPSRPAGSRVAVDQGRRRAARREQDLPGRDQRFPGARRRRLHDVPRRQAATAR